MRTNEFTFDRYRRHLLPAAIFLAIVFVAGWLSEVSVTDFLKGIAKGVSLLAFFFPPDWQAFPDMVRPAMVTIVICLVATPVGAVFSIFFGLAGARNIAPNWIRITSRTLDCGGTRAAWRL